MSDITIHANQEKNMRAIPSTLPARPSAIGSVRGIGNWDPSMSPQEVRRRAEAAKREHEQQQAARNQEVQRVISDNRRISSQRPAAQRAGLSVSEIYAARNRPRPQQDSKTPAPPSRPRSFTTLASNYYRDSAEFGTSLIATSSRGEQ